MLFSYKSIILYGLMAISHAYPLNDLSKRAKLGDFLCPDGTTLAESDVRSAFQQCRNLNDGAIGKYPAYFGNQGVNNQLVFPNIPSGTDLREFPIIPGSVYNGGAPGAYRVVTDYKNNVGNFRGVMQHTGATVGGGYSACTLVDDSDSKKADKGKDKRDSGNKDKHDNDDDKEKHDNGTASKRDSGNKDKHDNDDDKEKHDSGSENSVQDNSRRSTPSDSTNELTTRSKKKKVGSATCDDGVTLAQDDVANAFIECKKYNDYGVGGYPHPFGNQSGGQVFQGVTKPLREYPISIGGTWTGGEPGKYRVVTDYNNNFVGVMVESAGGAFSRCTVNSD